MALMVLAAFTGCSDGDPNTAEVSSTPSSLSFDAAGTQTHTATVTFTNILLEDASITGATWIKYTTEVDPNDKNKAYFHITVDPNTDPGARKGELFISVKNGTGDYSLDFGYSSIHITQAGADAGSLTVTPLVTALKFSADGLTAKDQDGTVITPTFTVSSANPEWDGVGEVTATPAGSWCTVTKTGNTFTVSAAANSLPTTPAPAKVTVTSGQQIMTIDVTQSGNSYLNIAPEVTALEFSADGMTAKDQDGTTVVPTFTVSASEAEWSVSATPAGSWCTVVKTGNTFTVSAAANSLPTAPAPATVTVTMGSLVKTIPVTQLPGSATPRGIYTVADYIAFADDMHNNDPATVQVKWAHEGKINLWDDIDLAGVTDDVMFYDADMMFPHTFNGNGNTVSNLPEPCVFYMVSTSGVVENLNVSVNSTSSAGAIAMVNQGKILGCTVTGTISGGAEAGAITSVNGGTIAGCTVNANISGIKAGGITGTNSGIIAACRVTGGTLTSISGTGTAAGGIVAENKAAGKVLACYSMIKTITYEGMTPIGGVIGSGSADNCGYLFWVEDPAKGYTAPGYAFGGDSNWGGETVTSGYNELTPFTATGNFQYRYMGGLYPDPATSTLAAMLNAGLATLTPAVGYEFTASNGTNPPGIVKK